MAISALATKFRIKPEQTLLILNAPQKYFDLLGELPQNKILTEIVSGRYAFIHLFVVDSSELKQWGTLAIKALSEDTVFWISYPKQTSGIKTDLNRDSGWEVIFAEGFRPVSQVAIDNDWSAIRIRKGTFSRNPPLTTKSNRVVEVPDDFRKALEADSDALKVFEKFAFTHRKEYVRWIEEAKKTETRTRRILKAIEQIAQGKKIS